MERLSNSGLVMSRIDVQRRMRPTISSLIRFVVIDLVFQSQPESVHRNTLYPGLEDHELVHKYPAVRGIAQNLFFLTHNHRENDGSDDTASKYNTYEVRIPCVMTSENMVNNINTGGDDSGSCTLPAEVRASIQVTYCAFHSDPLSQIPQARLLFG
jgi:hypothetical protein